MFETTSANLREFLYKRGIKIDGFDKRRSPEVVSYLDTPELRAAIREYETAKGRAHKRSLNRDEAIIRTPEELFASLICD
jgi:hypothetical protein